MKTLLIFYLFFLGITLTSCSSSNEKRAKKILSNPEMEEAIYSAIINDSFYLEKFSQRIIPEEKFKKILVTNQPTLKMICMSDHLDTLMSNDEEVKLSILDKQIKSMLSDPIVCDRTCTKIMENQSLRKHFQEYIKPRIDPFQRPE